MDLTEDTHFHRKKNSFLLENFTNWYFFQLRRCISFSLAPSSLDFSSTPFFGGTLKHRVLWGQALQEADSVCLVRDLSASWKHLLS